MLQSFLTVIALAATLGPAWAQSEGRIYHIKRWPHDIESIPCEAFKKNPDGSWTVTGTLRVGSGQPISGFSFKSKETAKLDKRCGEK
jgi:hypothetical protein